MGFFSGPHGYSDFVVIYILNKYLNNTNLVFFKAFLYLLNSKIQSIHFEKLHVCIYVCIINKVYLGSENLSKLVLLNSTGTICPFNFLLYFSKFLML